VIGRTFKGIVGAVRAQPWTFALVAAAMLALHIVVPPVVLSLARKPVDYFAFNAWLPSLPSFLLSGDVTLQRKLEALPKLALFWFSSSNPYGVEWGFTVDVGDLVRFVLTSALVGIYFALWSHRRARPVVPRWRVRGAGGGALGGFVSVLGLSTGPCSVMGCGAPVMPVVGLALAGLSSTTLRLLHDLSTITASAVLIALTASVAYLGWLVGPGTPRG
jgi:hypothetical protein